MDVLQPYDNSSCSFSVRGLLYSGMLEFMAFPTCVPTSTDNDSELPLLFILYILKPLKFDFDSCSVTCLLD